MAGRKWTPLLFPRSWQVVVVEVPVEEFEHVLCRNQQIWHQLERIDPEMAREVEPFLSVFFSNGNNDNNLGHHNTL